MKYSDELFHSFPAVRKKGKQGSQMCLRISSFFHDYFQVKEMYSKGLMKAATYVVQHDVITTTLNQSIM